MTDAATTRSVELRYQQQERLPAPIACVIHPWMRGYVLLRDDPYMAKTDANGRFHIENLPVGTHTFQLWHERAGYLRDIPIGAATSDRRGRLTVKIDPGENDLGDVLLGAALFPDH